jgi:hypothetical protein
MLFAVSNPSTLPQRCSKAEFEPHVISNTNDIACFGSLVCWLNLSKFVLQCLLQNTSLSGVFQSFVLDRSIIIIGTLRAVLLSFMYDMERAC